MSKGWKKRKQKGGSWAKQVRDMLEDKGHHVVFIGAEHIAPEVHDLLSGMELPDKTAQFIRFMPDCFLVHGERDEAYFVEAKAANNIEKQAYEAYDILCEKDLNVYLVIRYRGKCYCCHFDDLPLIDSRQVVEQYSNPLPIDQDGWIAPRLQPMIDYRRWKRRFPHASGTPYKRIDLDRLTPWKKIKTSAHS